LSCLCASSDTARTDRYTLSLHDALPIYFGTKDGNRYKCTFGADLSYLGDNQESYKFLNGQDRVYDVNNQTDSDDYSDLVNFIRVDRKSTRLNSSHVKISYAVFCLKKRRG